MKNYTGILLILLFFCHEKTGYSQQIPLFSMNSRYNSLINPAALDMDLELLEYQTTHSFALASRIQWTGIEDSPITGLVRYDRKFDQHHFLAGISLLTDKTGPTDQTAGYLRYAYQVPIGQGKLSLGLSAGFVQSRYNSEDIFIRDAGDEIALENSRDLYADFSLGLFYSAALSNGDFLYFGASIPQLAGVHMPTDGNEGNYFDYRKRHFQARLGYYKFMGNAILLEKQSLLEPSIRISFAENSPLKITTSLQYQINGLLWIGGGYATSFDSQKLHSNDFRLETGFFVKSAGNANQLCKIGYAYQHSLTSYQLQLGSTHELNISFAF